MTEGARGQSRIDKQECCAHLNDRERAVVRHAEILLEKAEAALLASEAMYYKKKNIVPAPGRPWFGDDANAERNYRWAMEGLASQVRSLNRALRLMGGVR